MALGDLDLNLLLTFEAVLRAGSVSGAAEALGVRQPTVSAALARLRLVFADELFVRAAGAMQPTPKTLRIAPGVVAALGRLRETLADAQAFDPGAATRTFTLASNDYTTLVLAPTLLAVLAEEAPGIDLRLIGYDKDDIPSLLDSGRIDLALGVFRAPPERAVRQTLYRERFVGLARDGHPLFDVGPPTLEAYARADHALVTLRRDAQGEIDQALRTRGLCRRVVLTLPHMLALPAVLRRRDLVATLPGRAAALLGTEGLRTFEVPLDLPPWPLDMLWNPAARSDLASAWLRETVVAVARGV